MPITGWRPAGLAPRALAVADFWLMAGGLAWSLFQPLVDFSPWVPAARPGGSLAEIAVALYCRIIAATHCSSSPREPESSRQIHSRGPRLVPHQARLARSILPPRPWQAIAAPLLPLVADCKARCGRLQIHGLAMLCPGHQPAALARWYGMRRRGRTRPQHLVLINSPWPVSSPDRFSSIGRTRLGRRWYLAAVVWRRRVALC